jgi:transposase
MADARTWAKRVSEWRASGLTAAAYCENHGVGLSALRHWSHRLGRRSEAPATTAAMTVRLARVVSTAAPAVTGPTEEPSSRPALVLEVRGARIMVDVGFDRATLAEVLDVLRSEGSR